MFDFSNMKIQRNGFNFSGTIDGDSFIFRGESLQNDNSTLIEIGDLKVTTSQAKANIDKMCSLISDAVGVMAIADKRYEDYSTALSFCDAIRAILRNGFQAMSGNINIQQLTVDAAKTTIDVAKEVALTKIDEDFSRTVVKASAFTVKKLLDWLNKADLA